MIYQYDNTANSNKGIGRLTRIVDGTALTDYTYDLQNTPRAILGASNGASPRIQAARGMRRLQKKITGATAIP